MDSYLKVGAIFNDEFINIIKASNEKSGNVIDEVYGSIALHERYTARPAFRLPNISMNQLEKFVRELKTINVRFNYTLNTSYLGSRDDIEKERKEIQKIIISLGEIGIMDYTVTLPYVAEVIRETLPTARINISTIAHIDTITQIKIWKKKYNITGICMNLLKNRDISFLRNAALYCKKENIRVELMVNEFCGSVCTDGNFISATHCIYREHCYQLHSIGYKKSQSGELQYPMKNCVEDRDTAVAWLKQRFIRPEDLNCYREIGINRFKVTGRTADVHYMKNLINAYVQEEYNGNVADLWFHLEHVEGSGKKPEYFLENKKLDGFVNFWFQNDFRCDDVICGEECTYCDTYYERTKERCCH